MRCILEYSVVSEAPIYMNTIGPHAAKVYPNEYSYNSSRIVDGSTSAINLMIRQLSNIYNKPGTPESARWLPVPVNKYAALGSLILISILTDFCHISVVKRLIDFCEDAAREVPEEDAKFYFEQMVDYFKNHYHDKRGLESASRVLGL